MFYLRISFHLRSHIHIPRFSFGASNRLYRDVAGFALKPSHLNAYELPDFVSGSPDSLNLTDIMLSEPFLFHVIVGAHGVGKSVAVRMAATELSKSRTVKYLFAPPADLDLYKLFYALPEWLLFSRKFLSCVSVAATFNREMIYF
jgi:hypothetical protein